MFGYELDSMSSGLFQPDGFLGLKIAGLRASCFFLYQPPVLWAQFESGKGLVPLKLEPLSVPGVGSCEGVRFLCVNNP